MKKLLKKQGFTLVELIVVIAIMAIMLAMLIPSLSTQSSFEQEARENARAFYSNVQELMIDEKLNGTVLSLSNDPKNKTNSKYTLIYAEVKTPSNTTIAVTDVSVIFAGAGDDISISNITSGTPAKINDSSNPIVKLQEFAGSLDRLLRASDNEGFYYAIVDDKYRVVYTYYSRTAKFDDMKGAGTFSSDYQVTHDGTSHYVGAYPFTVKEKDDPSKEHDMHGSGFKVFPDPDSDPYNF